MHLRGAIEDNHKGERADQAAVARDTMSIPHAPACS